MDTPPKPDHPPEAGAPISRRTFAARLSICAMAGGLAAGYGGMGLVAGRYLYPAKEEAKRWMFAGEVKGFKVGSSIPYIAPNGARVNIARLGDKGSAEDFIALSSTCPHLGCQVHWEPQRERFFCPCHNGVFNPLGKGIGGPPGDAGQNLPRYPLKIENGLLMIEVPTESLTSAQAAPPGSGEPSAPALDSEVKSSSTASRPCPANDEQSA